MSRGSIGKADETWVALAGLRLCAVTPGAVDEGDVGCGVTVGNRPVRLGGVIVAPGAGTSDAGGRV